MTWVKKTPSPHVCLLPSGLFEVGEGSVWKCEDCAKQWTLMQVTSSARRAIGESPEWVWEHEHNGEATIVPALKVTQ